MPLHFAPESTLAVEQRLGRKRSAITRTCWRSVWVAGLAFAEFTILFPSCINRRTHC